MLLEGPLRWPFALQAMHRVAIETPSLHFLKKMDKAFCIVIDSRMRILKQCIGWPSKPLPQSVQ